MHFLGGVKKNRKIEVVKEFQQGAYTYYRTNYLNTHIHITAPTRTRKNNKQGEAG